MDMDKRETLAFIKKVAIKKITQASCSILLFEIKHLVLHSFGEKVKSQQQNKRVKSGFHDKATQEAQLRSRC